MEPHILYTEKSKDIKICYHNDPMNPITLVQFFLVCFYVYSYV